MEPADQVIKATTTPTAAGVMERRMEARRTKRNWLLSAPALTLLLIGASGPLLIVLAYSFLQPGDFSGVIWTPTFDAWVQIFFTRDIFDET